MKLQINSFSGEVPHLNPRALPQSGAQQTMNVRLDDGALRGMNAPSFVTTVDNGPYSVIYKPADSSEWLAYPDPTVTIARGPIAQERLYIAGLNTGPFLRVGELQVNLALYPPTAAPSAAVTGTVDNTISQNIGYVYTWVTDWAEESAPSPLSALVLWSSGLSVTVTGFGTPPTGRNITRMRLYRSQTDVTGATNLYFLAERTVSTDPWTDASLPIQELCPSVNYDAAPIGLCGLVTAPNGIMAGFVAGSNILCFAEPYVPSAWPEDYQLTTDWPIIGLGVFGTTIVVLTEGPPYMVQGTAPNNMQMSRIDGGQPCIAARSIVDLGYGVVYASPDGLAMVSASGAQLISSSLLIKRQWDQMNPATLVAGKYAGRYVACYAYQDENGISQSGTLVFDTSGAQPFLLRSDQADGLFSEQQTGNLFMLRNGGDIYQYDPTGGVSTEYLWRSKQFVFPTPLNFGCAYIETALDLNSAAGNPDAKAAQIAANQALIDGRITSGDIGDNGPGDVALAASSIVPVASNGLAAQIAIYADGTLLATVTTLDRPVRLPAARLYRWVEIVVRATQPISQITLASQPSELASA